MKTIMRMVGAALRMGAAIGGWWLVPVLLGVPIAATAAPQAAGTVQMVIGSAQAVAPDGVVRSLSQGALIQWGDTVVTGGAAYAHLVFSNGSSVFMRPYSRLEVDHLPRPPRAPSRSAEQVPPTLLRFLRGAFRAVSGALAKHDRAAFGYATPVATIGIRGTEFEVKVAPDTTSSVFVVTGAVDVANPDVPGVSERVDEGQFTVVRPLRAPTPARAFNIQDIEAGPGQLGALERAEDPLLETSETPAEARYLAFSDPDLDVQRNPAYAAESRGRSATLAFAGHAQSQSAVQRFDGAGGGDVSDSGEGWLSQGVGLWQVRPARWIGAYGAASRVARRAALDVDATRNDMSTTRQRGGLALAQGIGRWALGASGVYDRSVVDVSGAAAAVSHNSSTAISLGGLRHPGGDRTVGLNYTRAWIRSDAQGEGLSKSLDGGGDTVEALYRASVDPRRGWGLRLSLERTSSDELVQDAGQGVYSEGIDVWAVKAATGFGWLPNPRTVVATDVALGYSHEDALQRHPDGRTREDELDERISAALHIGTQVRVYGPLVVSVDVTSQYLHDDKRFLRNPGEPDQQRERLAVRRYFSALNAGIGAQQGRWYYGYFASTDSEMGDGLTHNLFAVMHW